MTLDMIIPIKHLNLVRTTKLKISLGKYCTRDQRKINAQLAEMLVDEPYLSLTTAVQHRNLLLVLTDHWVTAEFNRVLAVLHAHRFEGSHTGE